VPLAATWMAASPSGQLIHGGDALQVDRTLILLPSEKPGPEM